MSSGQSSPVNGGYEAANAEPAMRLSVRKDLFPNERLSQLASDVEADALELDDVSCVKLETDFEQSIDEIAKQKLQASNGALPVERSRHRKHRQHSRRNEHTVNGCLPSKSKKRKSTESESRPHRTSSHSVVPLKVKGGKNLNLVSSSACQGNEDGEEEADEQQEEEESSEDEVLNVCRLKLPLISVPRPSGKPYSHELSQLSTKKSKSKDSKQRRTHSNAVIPCSGKPRSMLDICSSKSKKKSKKIESKPTYHSQIVGGTMKIKIKRTTNQHMPEVVVPTPVSIADIGQRKSKKKRAASPVASESSGEEYSPSRGETAAVITVAAPKPRHPPAKAKKTSARNKGKSEKTERSRINAAQARPRDEGPQSPWAQSMPEEILTQIFDIVVSSQGSLPSVIRLGRVCKLWHTVSCRPELWRNVDLAQYTTDKCKTDYKLAWLLENRLSRCQILNISHWKVCNVTWVLACVAEYCPELAELSVAGWSRLTADQLYDVFQTLPRLQRIDLSHTSETGGSGTCLSAASVARVVENFGERLTHLTLAHNMFTALQQILTSIAAHCSKLEVLDISGARASSHPAAVPLEALQKGCPNVRVFRAANAQLVLANATTSQQMECVGWTQLEELSVAVEAATERICVGEYKLGEDAIARLVRGATRLKLLDLRGLQRLTDSGLVRVPAWDLQHLFLGGCNILRQNSACLELICEKWSHSLVEVDMSWGSAERALDQAVSALADHADSKLRVLNLCGSSVSLEPVKKVLRKCPHIESLNLSSCRALPRGMKRLFMGKELQDLKDSLDPEKAKKAKEESENKDEKTESKTKSEESPKNSDTSNTKTSCKIDDKTSTSLFQEPKTPVETDLTNSSLPKTSPDCKSVESMTSKDSIDRLTSPSETKLLSPMTPLKPDSSSTPRSETAKTDMGSPHFSPVAKPDSQVQNSPDIPTDSLRSNSINSWNLNQFKTTPTHKSEASPLNRTESQGKLKYNKMTEQCSPTTSQDNKLSPENISNIKQDMKTPNSWNYGSYSPMPRQEPQFSSQRSPYSPHPSPAQPSPYSAQPSPYSTQPSPYSSQPSPYSAQPSPDTSQAVKQDLQKSSSAWNTGNYSPLTKHPAPYSPHPATLASPDPGLAVKDTLRTPQNKTPTQYSPMSRQDRIHQSPYSPRPSAENAAYSNKKSPGVGGYSPLMRPECHLPPDTGQTRSVMSGRTQDAYGRSVAKPPEVTQNTSSLSDMSSTWGMEKFLSNNAAAAAAIESLLWGTPGFPPEPTGEVAGEGAGAGAAGGAPPGWPALPPFEGAPRRAAEDPWSLGQYRVEPPHHAHAFADPASLNYDSLNAHIGHIQNFIDDSFNETSRVD